MFIDPEKAEERLNSPNNLANRLAEFRREKKILEDNGTVLINPGRQLPRLPPQVKEELKEKALSGKYTRKELAEAYGVAPHAVTQLRRKAEKEEEEKKDSQREAFLSQALQDIASQKMLLAMGLITEDKLATLKARELAQISSSLASVISASSPKNASPGTAINLVVYAPEVRQESSYKMVEIRTTD